MARPRIPWDVFATIYTVHLDAAPGGEIAVPTLAGARELRREAEEDEGRIVRVHVKRLPPRELACALLNRSGFIAAQEEVAPDKPIRPEED